MDDKDEIGHAIVLINTRLMEEMLQLPEGIRANGVTFSALHNAVLVHIEGKGLPHCEECEQPEVIAPRVERAKEHLEHAQWRYWTTQVIWDLPKGDE